MYILYYYIAYILHVQIQIRRFGDFDTDTNTDHFKYGKQTHLHDKRWIRSEARTRARARATAKI